MTLCNLKDEKLFIAGPCAFESHEQLSEAVKFLKEAGITVIRASLWKPRTQPGWEGLGGRGIFHLLEETLPQGLIPATEVLSPEQARLIVEGVKQYDAQAQILLWIGARNQNHSVQKGIAEVLKSGPEGIWLMFKNQMWLDENHWMGIYKHLLSTGFPTERMLTCHRGFAPGLVPNPEGYRNLPDFEMSMRIKSATGLPMILDPSHLGGSKTTVFEISRLALSFDFDGYMIEVHATPDKALTDAKQQLSFDDFNELLTLLRTKGTSYGETQQTARAA